MARLRLSELCKVVAENGLESRVDGADCQISGVNTLEDATEGEISFLANPKYRHLVAKTRASAVIVSDDIDVPKGVAALRCADPYAAITIAIIIVHGHRNHPSWGVSENASIDPSASLGANPNVAGGASIAADVKIGDDCTIYPGCYIAQSVEIGNGCTLFPNVVIYDHCVLGDRVTIHAGSVVGQDGLGYAPYKGRWKKIPQIGRAVIGDDVEIGANCAIDRATLGQTEIGPGTKLGNLNVVGHGAKIGPDCMLVGLVAVAGSVKIGRHVTLAGQVGVAGHITIGDDVSAGGRAAITRNVEDGVNVLGTPALPAPEWRRVTAATRKLPEYLSRIRDLERQVRELSERVNTDDQ